MRCTGTFDLHLRCHCVARFGCDAGSNCCVPSLVTFCNSLLLYLVVYGVLRQLGLFNSAPTTTIMRKTRNFAKKGLTRLWRRSAISVTCQVSPPLVNPRPLRKMPKHTTSFEWMKIVGLSVPLTKKHDRMTRSLVPATSSTEETINPVPDSQVAMEEAKHTKFSSESSCEHLRRWCKDARY